jgi:transposase
VEKKIFTSNKRITKAKKKHILFRRNMGESGHVRSKIWVDQNLMSKRELFNQDLSAGLKNPSGRGKRLIVVHIGNEKGFVNKGLLVFEGIKCGDYHDEMNSEKFEAWFTKILSLIPQNSVVVLDNAPYHSRVLEKWPTSAWRKEQIKEFLEIKQIPFENNLLKCELLDLASLHKPVQPLYAVEELAAAHNVKILRTPPYHCELNPIEMIWAQVKGYVAANNKTFKLEDVRLLLEKGIQNVTPERWEKCVQHVIKEEDKMWNLDGLMETVVEPLIINLRDSSNDSSDMNISDNSDIN